MSTTKPYLIRAIHEWCMDQGFTPYLSVLVDAHTRVPREFVSDGQIVLNVSTEATHHLVLGNTEITFQTRFSGASYPVLVPVDAVLAIYARENGQGMAFEVAQAAATNDMAEKVDAAATADSRASDHPDEPAPARASHLSLVK